MAKNSLVSICIPTFNRPTMLVKALDSAIGQTYANLEILVSDNCSPDPRVEEICRDYAAKDSRIRYFRQKENIGLYKNGSFLTEQVSGEFMFHLCDDDWLDLEFIAECVDVLANSADYAAVYGSTQLYDCDGKVVGSSSMESIEHESYAERAAFYAARNMYFQLQTAMYRTADIRGLKGDTFGKGRFCEDQIFIVKMLSFGKLKIIPHVRLHKFNGGLTKDIKSMIALFNLPASAADDFAGYCMKAIAGAVLWDEYFVENFSQESRLDIVAHLFQELFAYNLFTGRDPAGHVCTHKNLWRYLWRKPFALFDREYTIIFSPRKKK